ncbi:MAG: HAD family hydrolase [Chthoniobacteraceae bacterium]
MSNSLRPAVFFDRDGTLMEDVDYCNDPAQVRPFPGTTEALLQLKAHGYAVIVITNQSGIGRGRITLEQYTAVETRLDELIGPGVIDASYFCPHHPDEPCDCRKPLPGMALQAIHEHGIDPARSFFVGDKEADINCGKAIGARTILVETGYGKRHLNCGPDFVAKDVVAAVEFILKTSNAH